MVLLHMVIRAVSEDTLRLFHLPFFGDGLLTQTIKFKLRSVFLNIAFGV